MPSLPPPLRFGARPFSRLRFFARAADASCPAGAARARIGGSTFHGCLMTDTPKPSLSITYCTQCNWLLRSAWMAQEVLSTFAQEVGQVALVPGTGGIFEIHIDGQLVWERKRDGGFPDVRALKQLVRDRIDPDRDLGHIDRKADNQ